MEGQGGCVRRVPTFLALLGCLINALALPLHAASHPAPSPLDAALAADLAIICHGDGATTTDSARKPAPPGPMDQSNGCPVCKGVIGFQLAILVAGEIGMLEPASTEVGAFLPDDDRLSAPTLFAPRSRAPPLLV
jgi:hypothetical protein